MQRRILSMYTNTAVTNSFPTISRLVRVWKKENCLKYTKYCLLLTKTTRIGVAYVRVCSVIAQKFSNCVISTFFLKLFWSFLEKYWKTKWKNIILKYFSFIYVFQYDFFPRLNTSITALMAKNIILSRKQCCNVYLKYAASGRIPNDCPAAWPNR